MDWNNRAGFDRFMKDEFDIDTNNTNNEESARFLTTCWAIWCNRQVVINRYANKVGEFNNALDGLININSPEQIDEYSNT